MPTSVALGSHFEGFVKEQVRSGRYNNASEVVRDGLRLLEDVEAMRRLKLERLRSDIAEGLRSGPGRAAEDVLGALEARFSQPVPPPIGKRAAAQRPAVKGAAAPARARTARR